LQNINPLAFTATQNSNFRAGVVDQYNLQVEQQLGPNVLTIGYVGNVGHHLPQVIDDINQPYPYSTNPNSPLYQPGTPIRPNSGPRKLDPQFPGGNLNGIGLVQSEGISNYNGLQVSVQRRLTKGLAFDANYTWAKTLGDITGYSNEGAEGFSTSDPTRLRQIDYGIAENDIQNRFALSLNYQFQYGKTWTGLAKQALTGWEINTITVFQSGKPFTINNGGGNQGPGNNDTTTYINPANGQSVTESFSNRAVPNNGGGPDRPNTVGNPRGNKSKAEFFNISAFAPQPTGEIGTTARNSLFGPDFRHVDLSLFKNFPVTERVNLQFRAEGYNISNTPSFIFPIGDASTQLGSSNFGVVSHFDTNYTPRLYQFALKVQF
jgi:hypothetical protein